MLPGAVVSDFCKKAKKKQFKVKHVYELVKTCRKCLMSNFIHLFTH